MRVAVRYLRACWVSLPILFWCCAFLAIPLYIVIVYIPVIVVTHLSMAVMPDSKRRQMGYWLTAVWIPQLSRLVNSWLTRWLSAADKLWHREFGQPFPPAHED